MRIAFVVLLLSTSLSAQTAGALLGTICGPATTRFKVKLNDLPGTQVPGDPSKAEVYFIHDSGSLSSTLITYPTTKYAIDGLWMGAGHGNSWFSVAVAPGEHHVCATLQSSVYYPRVELAHFDAQAGMKYFFRTRLVTSREVELLELEPLDSDQGWLLINSYPMSSATPKK